jgi:hypothetical protein
LALLNHAISARCGWRKRFAVTAIAATLSLSATSCTEKPGVTAPALLLVKDSCPGAMSRTAHASFEWNKRLAVTACIPSTTQLEYLPGTDDIAGSLVMNTQDGKTTVVFAFELEGASTTSPEAVAEYVQQSEYAAVADPKRGAGGTMSGLIDETGRRGSIVRWRETKDQSGNSQAALNRGFGAFLSDGAVVLIDIRETSDEGFKAMLDQVLSIRAQRKD